MRSQKNIGFLLFGTIDEEKNVFLEEKYKALAEYFATEGHRVQTLTYNSSKAERFVQAAKGLDALLVWVNPIENGEDRQVLDKRLHELSRDGLFVSTHPDTILRIGTKRVLYETKEFEWGGDIRMYTDFQAFEREFPHSLQSSSTRVLKQFRGDGGNGVYKVALSNANPEALFVLHAKRGSSEERKTYSELVSDFSVYFEGGRPVIDQAWNENIRNGIVRCYVSGKKVSGFGYQEINALHPDYSNPVTPGRRFYYTENWPLFADLKEIMETRWIDQLMAKYGLSEKDMPVIWDADFFINRFDTYATGKYTLCEINVSCVSPFPESAISHIYRELISRL